MADIIFKFTPKADEELKIIDGGGQEFEKKWREVINDFIKNIDQEDPKFIILRQAFLERFKEHGFVLDSKDDYDESLKYMQDVIDKLEEIEKRNKNLANKYNGDIKFVRTHKRIVEHNKNFESIKHKPIISKFEEEIVEALNVIKSTIDQKVYDRNDILKKDAYFSQTVMQLVDQGLENLKLSNTRDDRLFIQQCISTQYLNQYRDTYSGY